MITDFLDEFERYRLVGEKAMAQVALEGLNRVLAPQTNSIGMLVHHISGNLRSRFTDFLSADGEKPWRNRDAEFEERRFTREELDEMWQQGWRTAQVAIRALSDADLERKVVIRGSSLTVHAALSRSVAHVATHVGQIVLLARLVAEREWESLSIPHGGSQLYNLNPTREKKPG